MRSARSPENSILMFRIDVDAIERCTLDPCKKLSLHNVVLYHEVLRYEVRNWLSSASEI